KQVWVSPGGGSDDGTRTERFVVCHNPEAAARDAAVRDRLIEHLEALIEGSDAWPTTRRDEFVGSLKTKPGLRRYLRRTRSGLLLIRVAETTLGDTWRNLRHELDRMHLVTLATADGRVAQRTATTNSQKTILDALQLPEPPQYLDFTTASS